MSDLGPFVFIVFIAVFLWLGGLTVVFWQLLMHYKRVARGVPEGDLIKALNKVLDNEEANKRSLKQIESEIARIDKHLVKPIQKVGLVRFNPFSEIGGDHSFSLCLLDGDNEGFILTSLHTRDRTRVYTKPVTGGESKFELSREEEKALKQAKTS